MRLLITIVAAAFVAYVAACVALFFFQRSLIWYPQPRALGQSLRETFERDGTTLVLTVRPGTGPGAVLYFGGNAEDVSVGIMALETAFPDRAIVALHYRGYGGSGGQPSEEATAADAAALFDRVQAQHPDVVVVGRSLGSGVAARLASTRPASRLVLVTPYDSLLGLAQTQFRAFPVSLLLLDRFESWRYAPAIHVPVTIIQAQFDDVIPEASTRLLATRFAPGQVRYVVVPGAGHNTISASPAYLRALADASQSGPASNNLPRP